ncbi:MAG: YeeE/YedE family protein [bacterium]|nr:YeeE/YedE family protein [bacterium]
MKAAIYLLLGIGFGTVLIASQAFHWNRINEMFHFESFHMYGLLGSAIATGALGVWVIKKFQLKSIRGNDAAPIKKPVQPTGNVVGGLFFGLGWGVTGACTAPLFIVAGLHWQIGLVSIAGALIGTLIFGVIKNKLPK